METDERRKQTEERLRLEFETVIHPALIEAGSRLSEDDRAITKELFDRIGVLMDGQKMYISLMALWFAIFEGAKFFMKPGHDEVIH